MVTSAQCSSAEFLFKVPSHLDKTQSEPSANWANPFFNGPGPVMYDSTAVLRLTPLIYHSGGRYGVSQVQVVSVSLLPEERQKFTHTIPFL